MTIMNDSSKKQLLTTIFLISSALQQNFGVHAAENPSGNCTTTTDANDNGGRVGYHYPDPTDTYLPDCQNPLNRELWRVFQKQDGTAYIVPRPDDSSSLGLAGIIASGLCTEGNNGAVNVKARKYGLCGGGGGGGGGGEETTTVATTSLSGGAVTDPVPGPDASVVDMNSMDPTDALLFTNVLHRQLRFGLDPMTLQMIPFLPPDNDILAACDLLDSSTATMTMQLDSKDYCSSIANRCNGDSCLEIAITPSPSAVHALVPALNALYGIPEVGQSCIPSQWQGRDHVPVHGCPVVDCTTAASGCEYVTGQYAINQVRDCCEKQCVAIDSVTGLSCTSEEEEVQSCNPIITGTDPLINCPPPRTDCSGGAAHGDANSDLPEGCSYSFGFYALDEKGNCCERQCYAIDEFGDDCSSSSSTSATTTITNSEPSLTEGVQDSGTTSTTTTTTTATQEEEEEDEDIMVDALPEVADTGTTTTTTTTTTATQKEDQHIDDASTTEAAGVGQLCSPQGGETCPVVRCIGAPQGCQYKEDHYVLGGNGVCCPAPCYLVDNNGNECVATVSNAMDSSPEQQDEDSNGIDTLPSDAARANTEETTEQEECEPTGEESCPVARCASPPDGCQYRMDHYVQSHDGTCCPSLCYAVDSNNNECPLPTTNQQEDQQLTGTSDENKEQPKKEEGDKCESDGNLADKCPVAGCTAAPPGCSYVEGPFAINGVGDCCPELCYSVDSDGNPCGVVDGEEDTEVTSAGAKESNYYGWLLLPFVLTVAHAVVVVVGTN